MNEYDDMTQDDFDRHLLGVFELLDHCQIMAMPGIYEILSEELNNETLDSWTEEQSRNNTP